LQHTVDAALAISYGILTTHGESESDVVKAAKVELETVLREIDVVSRNISKLNAAIDGEDDVAVMRVLGSGRMPRTAAVGWRSSRRVILS
jgi:hypothetical protein